MEAVISVDGTTAVCWLAGELEMFTASQLREAMASVNGFERVLLDFRGVTFLDSAGLGVLVSGLRRIREAGGEAVLCNPRPAVHHVLHIAGLDRIVTMIDSDEPGDCPAADRRHPNLAQRSA